MKWVISRVIYILCLLDINYINLFLLSSYFFNEIGIRYLIFNDLDEFMQIILNHFKSLFIKLILFVMNLGTN